MIIDTFRAYKELRNCKKFTYCQELAIASIIEKNPIYTVSKSRFYDRYKFVRDNEIYPWVTPELHKTKLLRAIYKKVDGMPNRCVNTMIDADIILIIDKMLKYSLLRRLDYTHDEAINLL